LLLVLWLSAAASLGLVGLRAADNPARVFIMTDMEGVCGVLDLEN
jgi:hypothetical protein